jgi:hypothetical protein
MLYMGSKMGFWGSIPGGGWEFFFSPPCPERLWSPPTSYPMGIRGSYTGGKAVTHLHLVSRSRMCGAIPPPPLQELRVSQSIQGHTTQSSKYCSVRIQISS